MKTIQVKKNLGSKKVAVLKEVPTNCEPEPQVNVWLKPGDKLKTDNTPETVYDGQMGDAQYIKVYYNGQEGWLVTSAIE